MENKHTVPIRIELNINQRKGYTPLGEEIWEYTRNGEVKTALYRDIIFYAESIEDGVSQIKEEECLIILVEYKDVKKQEPRIWTKEEFKNNNIGYESASGNLIRFPSEDPLEMLKELNNGFAYSIIRPDMIGKSVKWCKENGLNIEEWMIFK